MTLIGMIDGADEGEQDILGDLRKSKILWLICRMTVLWMKSGSKRICAWHVGVI